jgi:hypothetical protein
MVVLKVGASSRTLFEGPSTVFCVAVAACTCGHAHTDQSESWRHDSFQTERAASDFRQRGESESEREETE